jgi:hypothetical protein
MKTKLENINNYLKFIYKFIINKLQISNKSLQTFFFLSLFFKENVY